MGNPFLGNTESLQIRCRKHSLFIYRPYFPGKQDDTRTVLPDCKKEGSVYIHDRDYRFDVRSYARNYSNHSDGGCFGAVKVPLIVFSKGTTQSPLK